MSQEKLVQETKENMLLHKKNDEHGKKTDNKGIDKNLLKKNQKEETNITTKAEQENLLEKLTNTKSGKFKNNIINGWTVRCVTVH